MSALTWGWWQNKPNNPIPKYIGDDPRNIVLTLDELTEYDALLVQLLEKVQKERREVHLNKTAIEKRHHSELLTGRDWPRCTTLTDTLLFMRDVAKEKLVFLEFMCKITGRAAKEKKERDDAKLS